MRSIQCFLALALCLSLASALSISPTHVKMNISAGDSVLISVNISSEKSSNVLLSTTTQYCLVENGSFYVPAGTTPLNLVIGISADAPIQSDATCAFVLHFVDIPDTPAPSSGGVSGGGSFGGTYRVGEKCWYENSLIDCAAVPKIVNESVLPKTETRSERRGDGIVLDGPSQTNKEPEKLEPESGNQILKQKLIITFLVLSGLFILALILHWRQSARNTPRGSRN